MKIINVKENKQEDGIVAKICGDLDFSDIDIFKQKLLNLISSKFLKKSFTLLLDVRGYNPLNTSVHTYYSSFLKTTDIIKDNCKAVAHVHHSKKHIDDWLPYMDGFQGFFIDLDKAQEWIMERK